MYAITVLISNTNDHQTLAGTLFGTPPELLTGEQVRRYIAAPLGWSFCPLGYSVYATKAGDGSKIVVPGISVPGDKTKRKKFPGYNLNFIKKNIEDFAKSIVDEKTRIDEAAAAEMQALTHDIRALSAEIYTAAELVKVDISERQFAAATFRMDTVIAAQQMLSIRLDIVDFSTGQFLEQMPERIPVYKKVHKVVNCLKPKALATRITLNFQGPSSEMTYGPAIFELVPFVIVQNALKYAPPDTEIVIKVSDFEDHIDLHVQSLGPKIKPSEIESLFDRGFRGSEAKKTGKSGSGLGLYAAKNLTADGFGGVLSVTQDSFPASMAGAEYYRTTFTVEVPRNV